MIDIVCPKENEKKFVDMAKKLGYKALCFCYDFNSAQFLKFDFPTYVIIHVKDPKNIVKARKKADLVITSSDNRAFFEKGVDIIYNLENSILKDSVHYRESGLNQVLCNLCKRKDTAIGLSFSNLFLGRVSKIGRIIQNMMLARKYKLKCVVASFAKDPYDMRLFSDLVALYRSLGLEKPTYVTELIKRNKFKKSDKYISDGVYKV